MRLRALGTLLLAAGCASTAGVAPGPPVPPPSDDTCGATPQAALVGREAEALERVLIMRQVRVLRPGDPVTADLRPARINFEIDGAGRIARIFCG